MIAQRINSRMAVFILMLGMIIAACNKTEAPDETMLFTTPTTQTVATSTPTPTAAPSSTPSPAPTRALNPSSTTPVIATQMSLCAPLEGIPLAQVPDAIVNPFNPPRPGSDDPHQGVDLAQLGGSPRVALAGLPVNAVLAGQVAAVIAERFPYGNGLLIETPLDDLSPEWKLQLQIPDSPTTTMNRSALTCPTESDPIPEPQAEERALYLMYAHMLEPPDFKLDEEIECGQTIGAIGSSGNALNPHVHIEARVGPAGMRFSGMGHYDTGASPLEMGNYCLWRVSGQFQLIDPMLILGLQP